ncbi:hypothetical protein MPSEU_000842400 [Mayamaea pseudoterrestris]|nr:hypothetical protein MPSEU_000842400 [Mayamaea pseudoterrestris]
MQDNQEHDDKPDLLLDRLSHHAVNFANKRAVAWIAPGPNGGNLQTSLTYGELHERTTTLARHLLQSKQLQRNDRVVLVYPPSLDFMVAFIACLQAGLVAVPVFPPHPTRRETLTMFRKICRQCGANVALTNHEYNYQTKLANIRSVFQLRKKKQKHDAASDDDAATAAWPDDLEWMVTDAIVNSHKQSSATTKQQVLPTITPSDVAFLQYTSGSTSDPKGVRVTHSNLSHNLSIITAELNATCNTIVASWLPQYHDMGLIGSYLGCLWCGGTGYYTSPLSYVQRPMMWLEMVSVYQATHLQAPNFAFALTARKFRKSDYCCKSSDNNDSNDKSQQQQQFLLSLDSVRHIINAAEPIDEAGMQTFENTFAPYGLKSNVIVPTYGLAEHTVFVCGGGTQRLNVDKEVLETSGRVVIVNDNDAAATTQTNGATDDDNDDTATRHVTKLVGCGYPSKHDVTVKIVDPESLQELPCDQVGEVWVDSPSKAAGYYGMPEETLHDFHAKLVHDTGEDNDNDNSQDFLRTGDLGFIHNHELFICGRRKDLIIIGGRNYYPQDIEATAEASFSDFVRPGCAAAFTINTLHEGGEQVALVLELKDAKSGNDETWRKLATDIRAAVNQEHSLGLAEIVFLQPRTIPKTSSGKIARAWCRKAFLGNTLKVVYRQSFKSASSTAFETEGTPVSGDSEQQGKREDAMTIRQLSKSELLARLTTDLSKMADVPAESIDKNTSLVCMLDSLTISQFKGLLESKYATKLSDEYLFRESTTPQKLVEVVKLGYAPDDGDTDASAAQARQDAGKASGLAGALGCPPGVVCIIM